MNQATALLKLMYVINIIDNYDTSIYNTSFKHDVSILYYRILFVLKEQIMKCQSIAFLVSKPLLPIQVFKPQVQLIAINSISGSHN